MSDESRPFIVGISGASGSGKTTFMRQLTVLFSTDEICLISLDNYYKARHLQPLDEKGIENYDTLESIDIEAFTADLEKLKQGESFQKKEYDFNNPNFITEIISYNPTPIIVLEGIFLFSYPEILAQIDLKIFIETEDHHRISRRLERDLIERGYTIEQTMYWMKMHVEPAYKQFVLPYKSTADLVIPNNNNFEKAIKIIEGYFRYLLAKK